MKKWMLCGALAAMTLVAAGGCSHQVQRVETDEEFRNSEETDETTLGETSNLYDEVEQENRKKTGETVISGDGLYQMILPQGWKLCTEKINETMLFELQGGTEDQYVGVLVLSDEVYGALELNTYMDAYEDNIREQFENAIMSERKEENINGYEGYSLKIVGLVDQLEYINHIYAVDYEEEIVIFTVSTYKDHEAGVISDLEEVVDSFEKIKK